MAKNSLDLDLIVAVDSGSGGHGRLGARAAALGRRSSAPAAALRRRRQSRPSLGKSSGAGVYKPLGDTPKPLGYLGRWCGTGSMALDGEGGSAATELVGARCSGRESGLRTTVTGQKGSTGGECPHRVLERVGRVAEGGSPARSGGDGRSEVVARSKTCCRVGAGRRRARRCSWPPGGARAVDFGG